MKKRTLIFIIIILMIIVSLLFYMTRGHYETVTYEMGDIIDETHQISSFHVRAYLDTQIIYISNVKSGAYCIRIYYVPENDINYKLINSSPEEIGELYIMNGYKGIAINENLDLVYEAEISESGEYVIDTQDLKKGTYLIERYGTGDVDITFTQSFEYTNYNWMKYEKKIRTFINGEDDDRYLPY